MSYFDLPPIDEPQPGLLDQLLAEAYPSLAQVRGGPPQSFLEGLGQGFVGGLATRGQRVARQRALFEERQRQRQAAVDQARIAQATAAANRAGTLANEQQLATEKFNRENPALTAEDIAAFPAGTAGSKLKPGMPLSSADRVKLMSEETSAQKESRLRREHKAMAEGSAAGGPGAGEQVMDAATIHTLAERGAAGGGDPNFGMGKAGVANKVAYYNELTKIIRDNGGTGADLANATAGFKANQSSLASVQKLLDASTAWSNTAHKNTDQAVARLRKVVDLGAPWINTPLRNINRNVLGSADQAAYDAAIRTVIPEYARLLSSPSATGVLSDAARQEAEGIINKSYSLAQMLQVIDVLQNDASNRTQAYEAQVRDIKWRIAHPGKVRRSLGEIDQASEGQ